MNISPSLIGFLKKQAEKSPSSYRIGGLAFSKKGNVLGFSFNSYRRDSMVSGRGSGKHCETDLIKRYGRRIATIVIIRIGNGGDILKIDPCDNCKKIAEKFGIKIVSIAQPDRQVRESKPAFGLYTECARQ